MQWEFQLQYSVRRDEHARFTMVLLRLMATILSNPDKAGNNRLLYHVIRTGSEKLLLRFVVVDAQAIVKLIIVETGEIDKFFDALDRDSLRPADFIGISYPIQTDRLCPSSTGNSTSLKVN